MNDTLKVVQVASGLSDTVLLAIIAAFLAVATLILNAVIQAKAKKAETVAALEAAKVADRLEKVEIKIDGRLTELLDISRKEAEERGMRLGREGEKKDQGPVDSLAGHDKLTITGDEMKVKGEKKEDDKTKKK